MRKILIIILLIGIPVIFVAIYLYTKPVKDLTHASPDYVLEASVLYEEFAQNEAAANKKYVNKILEVSGMLAGKQTNNNGSTSLFLLDDLMGINCSLDSAYSTLEKEAVKSLKTGEKIIIKGKCNGMLTDVQLSSCILVKPETRK